MEQNVEYFDGNKITLSPLKINSENSSIKIYSTAMREYKNSSTDAMQAFKKLLECTCTETDSQLCEIDMLKYGKLCIVAKIVKTSIISTHPIMARNDIFSRAFSKQCIVLSRNLLRDPRSKYSENTRVSMLSIPLVNGQLSMSKIGGGSYSFDDIDRIYPIVDVLNQIMGELEYSEDEDEDEDKTNIDIAQANIEEPSVLESNLEFTEENLCRLRSDVANLRLGLIAIIDRLREAGIIQS